MLFNNFLMFLTALLVITFHWYHQLGWDQSHHTILLQRCKSVEIVSQCVIGGLNPNYMNESRQLHVGYELFHQGSTDTVGLPQHMPIVLTEYQLNKTHFVLEWKRVEPSGFINVAERYSWNAAEGHLKVRVSINGYLTWLVKWLELFDSFHYWRLNSCIGRS
ncbi:hypothetical protein C9374_000932 [Naegleria lovaniensis]|uniref:Uncharacterized protein n=1 Tax=Naegleria lovaniensis TaxID=51637 RepID=A0AA88GW23_NAELO|nr:uncharacterized protein C9374_000932 [Naegleria lovaniensis]KAG2388082.1 hypothetical protein C9374_000932 [Naegleria lovaniensis]